MIGFLIPFAFVYQPSMLLINDSFSWSSLLIALVTTTAAILLVAAAFSAKGIKRVLYMAAGFAVLAPLWWVQLAGLVILPLLLVRRRSGSLPECELSCKQL